MAGIDAGTVAAEVVDLKPVGDRLHKGYVRKAMREPILPCITNTAISLAGGRSCPYPAATVFVFRHSFQEPL
jgi:hypothetical protein